MKQEPDPSSLRSRLIYFAMSAFVVWHAFAITVGPAPRQSEIAQAVSPLVNPYLNLIYLNVGWGFFAPVGFTREIRYRIETADGKTQTILPTRDLPFYSPSTLWIKDRLRGVAQTMKTNAAAVIADLCSKYAHLKPVKLSMVEVAQQRFLTPEDHRAGKTPLGKEFADETVLGAGGCPKA